MRPLSTPTTPEQARTLWMGNVEPWMTPEFIQYELFSEVSSQIENVKMLKARDGSPAGFCFVKFKGQDIAADVLNIYRGKPVGEKLPGRIFKLNYAGISSKPQKPHQSFSQPHFSQMQNPQYPYGNVHTGHAMPQPGPHGLSHPHLMQHPQPSQVPYPSHAGHAVDPHCGPSASWGGYPNPSHQQPHPHFAPGGPALSLAHIPFHGANDAFVPSGHFAPGASSGTSSASSFSGNDEPSDQGPMSSHGHGFMSLGEEDSMTSSQAHLDPTPHHLSSMRHMTRSQPFIQPHDDLVDAHSHNNPAMSARGPAPGPGFFQHAETFNGIPNNFHGLVPPFAGAQGSGSASMGEFAPGTTEHGRCGAFSDTDSVVAGSPNGPCSVDSTAAPQLLDAQNSTVYISNLSPGITENEILAHFSNFGHIENLRMRPCKSSDHLLSAFLTYGSRGSAESCVNSGDVTFRDSLVRVSFARSPLKSGHLPAPFTPKKTADGCA